VREFVRLKQEDIDRCIAKGFPCVEAKNINQTNFKYPVDDAGLIFCGKRWEIGVPPGRKEIEEAKRILISVPLDSKRGARINISLYELKHLLSGVYFSNGAAIIAAFELGFLITAEDLNGCINVSRKWYNELMKPKKRYAEP
jgi:hypothetical protein